MAVKTWVTKHSRKRKRVKGHWRKVKGIGKPRISKKERQVFDKMAELPFEAGGYMDFEGKRLENIKTHIGNKSSVEFAYDPDYEIGWHTHPTGKQYSIMPSYEDLLSMKETDEKEQVIINKNVALSIAEERKFRRVSNKQLKDINLTMHRDFVKGMSDKKLFSKYRPIFKRELGLSMRWHGKRKAINLLTRSV